MAEIKPIETHYKGYRFRSRLEARWAVFFDALGIEWEYEKEGYDLGELGWYLPDFWLSRYFCVGEIKPYPMQEDDLPRLASIGRAMTHIAPFLVLWGTPDFEAMHPLFVPNGSDDCGFLLGQLWFDSQKDSLCLITRKEVWKDGIAPTGKHALLILRDGSITGFGDDIRPEDARRLLDAFQAARSARFER